MHSSLQDLARDTEYNDYGIYSVEKSRFLIPGDSAASLALGGGAVIPLSNKQRACEDEHVRRCGREWLKIIGRRAR